jgi:hypothetical protein
MFTLITKIVHSSTIKDTIAVARGIYRVVSVVPPSQDLASDDWITTQNNNPKFN